MKKPFPSILILALLLAVWPVSPSAAIGTGDLWVDVKAGSDANDGTSASRAFRTIQAAAKIAVPGTTIHILPGVYREAITPASDGTATSPIVYKAESGPGTVTVRGSVAASSLTWSRLTSNSIGLPSGVNPANIYYANLASWGLAQPPRYLVELDGQGDVTTRFMPAREPDWQVPTWWKGSEFWWLANGGSSVAGCDPISNSNHQCDLPWRSYTQLTDTTSDSAPAGVEPGNLSTLGNLTGATLVAMDSQHGHYIYHATIVAHDVASGRVTVSPKCDNDGTPGLGWGSKYYVENHPALLDQPGEWWFDVRTGLLYLWSPNGTNPGQLNLEISRRDTGFDLSNRSFITLNGFTIELFNQRAYAIWNSNSKYKAFGDVVTNSTLRYANQGVVLYQYMNEQTPLAYAIDKFVLSNSEIAYMDTTGIDSSFWWPKAPAPGLFNHSGVRNTIFQNNHLHDLGFNSDDRLAVGARILFPDKMRFVSNTIDHTAHVGVHFLFSLVDSPKQYGFSPQEIKLGDILIAGNTFDKTCMLASDCGALKFGGSQRPYTHVFRNVLITGNVFRNGVGWSYVSTLRGKTQVGDANGFYLDHASGVHVYRNIAYNNTGAGFKLSCLWRDGDAVFYNNIVANNYMYGFKLTGVGSCDNHNGSINTRLVNNILVNNEAYGIEIESAYGTGNFGSLVIDRNLYYDNGWNTEAGFGNPANIQLFEGAQAGQYFHNLREIQLGTPWERHGVEGDPAFMQYDPADHNRFDDSWPDFHLTPASANAIDRGTIGLPTSLSSLLTGFGIADVRHGGAFDIGRFEAPANLPAFTVNPASWNYGVVKALAASADKVFTIQNTGSANLVFASVVLGGTNPRQFLVTADSCSNASLSSGAICSVTVTFKPTRLGRMTAVLLFTDNALGSPQGIALKGAGAAELARNGGFNDYPTTIATIPANWTATAFSSTDGKSTVVQQEGTASIQIANTFATTKVLKQTLSISGTAGNTLQLSAWVAGQSIPSTAGLVQVQVRLYNGSTLVQGKVLNFPTGTYGFTQRKLVFAAVGAYNKIIIKLIYSKGSGTAWFDGVSLLRTP